MTRTEVLDSLAALDAPAEPNLRPFECALDSFTDREAFRIHGRTWVVSDSNSDDDARTRQEVLFVLCTPREGAYPNVWEWPPRTGAIEP